MLVCHCKRVSDRAIRSAVQSGATCRSTVGRLCGAGTGCGGCLPAVDQIIETEKRDSRASHGLPVLAAS